MVKKRYLPFLLAAAMAVSMAGGCGGRTAPEGEKAAGTVAESAQETKETAPETVSGNKKQEDYLGKGTVGDRWYASSIAGAVSGDTEVSLKDDFFTAVNKDYLAGLVIEDGYSSAGVFQDANNIMRDRTLALLNEEDPETWEGKLVSRLYELALDWEGRDEAGFKPVLESVEQIKAIRTVDDLIRYETGREDVFRTILSGFTVENSLADPGNYTVGIYGTPLFLDDPKEYSKQSEDGKLTEEFHKKKVSYMLERLGFSEEEAGRVWEGCRTFETAIAGHMLPRDDYFSDDIYDKIINVYTLEELGRMQGNYPLVQILKAYGMEGSDTYNLFETEWLPALSGLYSQENLENIKDYLLAHYVSNMAGSLDREAYDTVQAYVNERYGITGTRPEEETGLDIVNSYLSQAMDYVYIDAYCTQEERQRVVDMIHDFTAYYRAMLEQEDWLSENTKQRAVEKLDNLTIRACYSDTREDYSRLDFSSKAEGGTYLEALQAIARYHLVVQQEKINQKVSPDIWEMSTREVNAYYSPSDNSINILCGTLVGAFSMDQPYEAVLATVGAQTIGHEISHAFDTTGAQFDKDGNYENWWEDEDYDAFNQRADRLVAYMDQIIPYEGASPVRGDQQKTEMIADLGGMKAALMMAGDRENFDYDAFFRGAAKGWAVVNTKNSVVNQQQTDPHPLNNLRVNIPLQNSEEFMETYEIRPGDGMYLAPEDRVNVW